MNTKSKLRRSGTDVKVSWPSVDTTGFGLEQASSLVAPANWVPNTAPVTDDQIGHPPGHDQSAVLPPPQAVNVS
jgi:hypothetical protein